MNQVTRNNYFTVMGFMREDFNLKGNELIIYAIIFGFCQSTDQMFYGSLSYLTEWSGATKPTVIAALKSLEDKKLIIKEQVTTMGITHNAYRLPNISDLRECMDDYDGKDF